MAESVYKIVELVGIIFWPFDIAGEFADMDGLFLIFVPAILPEDQPR